MAEFVSDAEAKRLIVETGRRLYERELVSGTDGNISCRCADGGVWATPTMVSKGFMTPEMLVKLDLDGNILEGDTKPSSEIKLHLRIYKEDGSLGGVIHAHPLYATAYAVAGKALGTPIMIESVEGLGAVPLVGFALPGTDEVPNGVMPYVKTHNAVLMANHGVAAWGRTLGEAHLKMEMVEYCARIDMYSKYIIGSQRVLSNDQIAYMLDRRIKNGSTRGGIPEGIAQAENLDNIE